MQEYLNMKKDKLKATLNNHNKITAAIQNRVKEILNEQRTDGTPPWARLSLDEAREHAETEITDAFTPAEQTAYDIRNLTCDIRRGDLIENVAELVELTKETNHGLRLLAKCWMLGNLRGSLADLEMED
jgi:hypothetical protein